MICNTRLSLSLGSSAATPHHNRNNNKGKSRQDDNQELTLCLSTSSADQFTNVNCEMINPQLLGVNSSVSSFSNTSVKRERDVSSLEEEVENLENRKAVLISPKVLVDHDNDIDEDYVHEYGTRKKLRLTKEQSDVLEDSFKDHTTLNSKQKRDLARRLSLRPRQVEVWFQNRRARTKLKQTEVDCEILRKCYEDLREENKRLNKEIQDVKSMKMSTPFRLQLSAATLSMCPSCERTYSGAAAANDNSTKISYSIGDQKHHFYGVSSQMHQQFC